VRRAGAEPEPPAIIEIFVSYTPKALKGAGGQDGMDALIDECILVTNQGFENSHINARLHLAGSWLTGYQESGNSATDLNNLLYGERNGYTGKSDDQGAYAAAVGPLLGIDITCTIVDSLSDGTAGRAGILTSGEVGRGKVGLSVVSRRTRFPTKSATISVAITMRRMPPVPDSLRIQRAGIFRSTAGPMAP
jgi:hypothetical protein